MKLIDLHEIVDGTRCLLLNLRVLLVSFFVLLLKRMLSWKNKGRPPKVAFNGLEALPSHQQAQQVLVDLAVKGETVSQYRSRATQVARYTYQCRVAAGEANPLERPLEKKDFFLYLHAACAAGMGHAEGLRSAVLHLQLSGELMHIGTSPTGESMGMRATDGSWLASDPDTSKAIEGLTYKGGKTPEAAPKPRGAITREMAEKMIEWVENLHPQLAEPIRILTYCGLRCRELVSLKEGGIIRNDEGTWLMVSGDKRRNASNCREVSGSYLKLLVMPEAIESLERAYKRVGKGEPLWQYGRLSSGGWCRDELIQVIKRAQVELNWDPALSYVPHSLRHGAIQEMNRIVTESHPDDKERLRILDAATQQTAGTRTIYLKENCERINERALKSARTE